MLTVLHDWGPSIVTIMARPRGITKIKSRQIESRALVYRKSPPSVGCEHFRLQTTHIELETVVATILEV